MKVSTGLFIGGLGLLGLISDGFVPYLIAAILLISLFFSVLGYRVLGENLVIQRLLWRTRYDLKLLSGIEVRPYATAGSIRLVGIGGMFASVGTFRNPSLGNYRAYITDPKNAVVLDFSGEIVVVTPDDPLAFERAIWQARHAQHRSLVDKT